MRNRAAHTAAAVAVIGLLYAVAVYAGEGRPYYEPMAFEAEPGTQFYMFQDDAFWADGVFSARKFGTTDCVTPPSALECSFPAVDGPAGWLCYDLNQAFSRENNERPAIIPADAVALSLYVRGDGSQGAGRIELRGEDNRPGPGVEFPLSDTTWRRIVLKWSDFSPAADPTAGAMLAFGLKSDSPRPAHYLVDAVRLEKTVDEDAELAKLAAAANEKKGPVPIEYRLAPGACACNKTGLAKAREKVRKGETMKWLAYGDSVTVPVQLWNIPEKYRPAYAYYRVAAAMLEREYGAKIDLTVDAVGGRQLSENFDNLIASLDKVKPDVLIMHPWDVRKNYETYMPQAIAAARKAGSEVLVVVPVYDQFALRDPDIDWLRRFCIDNNIACADARTYLLGAGEVYWGGYFANPMHPGPEGHRLMGQALAEMFR